MLCSLSISVNKLINTYSVYDVWVVYVTGRQTGYGRKVDNNNIMKLFREKTLSELRNREGEIEREQWVRNPRQWLDRRVQTTDQQFNKMCKKCRNWRISWAAYLKPQWKMYSDKYKHAWYWFINSWSSRLKFQKCEKTNRLLLSNNQAPRSKVLRKWWKWFVSHTLFSINAHLACRRYQIGNDSCKDWRNIVKIGRNRKGHWGKIPGGWKSYMITMADDT